MITALAGYVTNGSQTNLTSEHRHVRTLFCSFVLAIVGAGNLPAGDLRLRFQYEGELPKPQAIEVKRDAEFCGQHKIIDESLLVHPEDRGIKNVVVYLYTGPGGSEIEAMPALDRTHTMTYKNCRFDPHILVMQAGDRLKFKNSDPVGHNGNLNVLRNPAFSLMLPSQQSKGFRLELPEPAPIPLECNIHPWMKSYVVVMEHPYVGVSDEHGTVVIRNLPDKQLTFGVFVEAAAGALGTVSVNGKPEQWSRNRFSYDVQAGRNDIGTVTLTADKFRRSK